MFEAALDLFARHGYEGVRITQLIEASGLPAGSFYRLFGTKDAVLDELLTTASDRTANEIRARRATPLDDPVDDLREQVRVVVDVGQTVLGDWMPRIRRVVANGAPPAIARAQETSDAGTRDHVLPILHRAAAAGRLRDGLDLEAVAEIVIAIVDRAVLAGVPSPDACADFVVHAVIRTDP